MKLSALILLLVCAGVGLCGCATQQHHPGAALAGDPQEVTAIRRVKEMSDEAKAKVLSLNPEHVTEQEVRGLLSECPAPRILAVHGGLLPIKTAMNSFAQFLIGMGYPETSIRHPGSAAYAYGYYDRSDEIAGTVAWYYEQDGLRPILVGHSQGGIQAIRVLHKLAGNSAAKVAVWNPVTQRAENRHEIIDPLTGKSRPVVGLQVSYATAAVAGGLARVLPNQWDMNNKLRKIPDSVEEFTGFQKGFDLLGGDFLGYGSANEYHATGRATVRNVRLPALSPHSRIPYAKDLPKHPAIRAWLANYEPSRPMDPGGAWPSEGVPKNAKTLWAAEIWYGIKKHWVLELQQLIRTRNSHPHDG